jgi:hypothetical protein
MTVMCNKCEKIFKTNQHLTQHKNRKKPCQNINHNDNTSSINNQNNQNILEIMKTQQNILIQENAVLKNNIKDFEQQLLNISFKQELTQKFIKYILNNDNVDEDILQNISMLLTNAESQKNNNKLAAITAKYRYSTLYKTALSNLINTANSSAIHSSNNSVISDLTNSPPVSTPNISHSSNCKL